jgi:predicted nuclease of restriction endonuclease-like (RecB) superfamily
MKDNHTLTALRIILLKRRATIINTANAELIHLLWETGKHFNQYQKGKAGFTAIANKLNENYGDYFSPKQLNQMRLFAEIFPDFTEIKQAAWFLSWEHFLLFIKIENKRARQFFMELAMERNLDPKALKREISKALHKDGSINKAYSLNNRKSGASAIHQSAIEAGLLNTSANEHIFKEPGFTAFRELTAPQSHTAAKNLTTGDQQYKPATAFIEAINNRIRDYSFQMNILLNGHINLLFREIGAYLNTEVIYKCKRNNLHSVIREIAAFFTPHGFKITEQQLHEMAAFAEKVPDITTATWISHTLSWEHIRMLLPLQHTDAFLYYTKLTTEKGLSARSLRKEVSNNKYETVLSGKGFNPSLVSPFEKPLKGKSVKRQNKLTETITTIDYQFNETNCNVKVVNIFRNHWLARMVNCTL